jgi:pheromone shutdown-related protein TraB
MYGEAMSDGSAPTPEPPGTPTGEGIVSVLGTAHVSEESVAEVEETIERERPDIVAVELDEGRYRQLKGQAPDDLDPSDLLEGNTVFQFLAYWLLSYVQARLGDRFDIEPGADMMAAVDSAEELGLGVALVDRNIQTTIQRFWQRMTFVEKLKLVWGLVVGMVGAGGDPEEEIDMERITDGDVVTAMMEEFRRFSPGGAEALIDERDAYIAHKLVALREEGYDVVAVVGAGHRDGILEYLDHPETLPPFESLVGVEKGRRFSFFKLFGYLFTLGFLVFFVLLALGTVDNAFLVRIFAAWFLVNGVISFALAKLAGAHWQSATVGGAIAWLTSVNPLLAPGWFAGYVELRYIDVNLGDINTLNEILSDEESPVRDIFARMRAVPLFRLILIVAMTNVGSIIASFLFATVLLPYMAADIGGVSGIADQMVIGARNGADLLLGLMP